MALDAARDLRPAFEESVAESCLAIVIAATIAIYSWFKQVTLTGKIRMNTTELGPGERLRYRVTSTRIFLAMLFFHLAVFALIIHSDYN